MLHDSYNGNDIYIYACHFSILDRSVLLIRSNSNNRDALLAVSDRFQTPAFLQFLPFFIFLKLPRPRPCRSISHFLLFLCPCNLAVFISSSLLSSFSIFLFLLSFLFTLLCCFIYFSTLSFSSFPCLTLMIQFPFCFPCPFPPPHPLFLVSSCSYSTSSSCSCPSLGWLFLLLGPSALSCPFPASLLMPVHVFWYQILSWSPCLFSLYPIFYFSYSSSESRNSIWMCKITEFTELWENSGLPSLPVYQTKISIWWGFTTQSLGLYRILSPGWPMQCDSWGVIVWACVGGWDCMVMGFLGQSSCARVPWYGGLGTSRVSQVFKLISFMYWESKLKT